jgi:hypothetical protein
MPKKYYTEDELNDIESYDYWNAFLTGGIVTGTISLLLIVTVLWLKGCTPLPATTSLAPILPSIPDPVEYEVPPCGVLDAIPATFKVETFAF